MTGESKTLPVLQADTDVQDARKGDDAQGFDGGVKRSRHVNRTIIPPDRPKASPIDLTVSLPHSSGTVRQRHNAFVMYGLPGSPV
jgi:hypothetical protein